jgi:hypothetical protein
MHRALDHLEKFLNQAGARPFDYPFAQPVPGDFLDSPVLWHAYTVAYKARPGGVGRGL